MRKLQTSKPSEIARIGDGLVLLDELTGADTRLRGAIEEARLLLEIAQAAHAARASSDMSAEELDLYTGLRPGTVARLERAGGSPHAFAKLRRIAQSLELDLRIVLVPRRPPSRAGRVADIAKVR